MTLSGCNKKQETVQEYVVNSTGVIYVGVLLPLSGENADTGQMILESISYAKETASHIKLDTEYQIELISIDSADLDLAYERFNTSKVTSVICYGGDKLTTDAIINKFNGSGIPLVFLDNHSNLISGTENAFSISVYYNYQCSAASAYLIENFMRNGAALITEDTDEYRAFADLFDSTFLSGGGMPVIDYVYDGSDSMIDTIVSADYDFVFVIGSEADVVSCYRKLHEKGFSGEILLSEINNKKIVSSSDYEGLSFISKFEADDENYIGSDFINVYSAKNSIKKSEVSSAIAYGYDGYMLVYEVLHSFAKDDPMAAIKGNTSENSDISDITLSKVLEALRKITYYGVTDTITFGNNGISKTNFIYVDKVVSGYPEMMERYAFSN